MMKYIKKITYNWHQCSDGENFGEDYCLQELGKKCTATQRTPISISKGRHYNHFIIEYGNGDIDEVFNTCQVFWEKSVNASVTVKGFFTEGNCDLIFRLFSFVEQQKEIQGDLDGIDGSFYKFRDEFIDLFTEMSKNK